MNYGRRLAGLALDTLNDDLIRGMLPKPNSSLSGEPVSRELTTQRLSFVDSRFSQGDLPDERESRVMRSVIGPVLGAAALVVVPLTLTAT